VFIASGAIEYGKGLLVGYLEQAKQYIEKLDTPNNDFKKHLYEIIDILSGV
jgi:geranylgeranyl pyrophosphate synthase